MSPADRIEWIFRADDTERTSPEPLRIAMDDPLWRATIERFSPSEGLRMTLSTADVHREFVFDVRQAEPEPWLVSHIPIEGVARFALSGEPAVELDPSHSLLLLPAGRRGMFTLPPQKGLRHAGFSVRYDRVRQMFGEELPEAVAAMIEGRGPAHFIETRTSTRMRRLAASLFDQSLHGSLRAVFMEGVSLQLLALQAAATGGKRKPPRLTARSRRALAEARDRLLGDMANPPTLAALASDVGMSGKALNAGFRRIFGGTVFELLRNERLEHARIALETDSASIKQIAHAIGYAHVANFNAAFARRYGAPPLRYRLERTGASMPTPPRPP